MSQPKPQGRAVVAIVIGVICASMSGAALLSHAVGLLRMPFFITCISLPAAVGLIVVRLWSRGLPQQWLAQRLWAGCWIGFVGTLVYDGVREFIVLSGIYRFDPFRIILLLGSLITGRPETDFVAVAAGWLYHFWNGINFGLIYTLVAGRGWWPYAVVWAMCLETLMMLTYPGVFQIYRWDTGFISCSMAGHVGYGLTLGFLAQRQRFLPLPRRESASGVA